MPSFVGGLLVLANHTPRGSSSARNANETIFAFGETKFHLPVLNSS
jgi:hypothetical protein